MPELTAKEHLLTLKRNKTLQQQIDYTAGQVMALSVATHAILRTHPNREKAARTVHEDLEEMIARLLASGFSDEMIKGLQGVRDGYLLKKPDDPGQPQRK